MNSQVTTPLSEQDWRVQCESHRQRLQPWTQAHRTRRNLGQKHPVYDFLFDYYSFSPTKLETWHPRLGQNIEHSPDTGAYYLESSFYTLEHDVITHNFDAISSKALQRIQTILTLQRAIQERPPAFACYGLHEWAMVYKTDAIRHASFPLRLSPEAIDTFVDSQKICCSHYDAYRFFTSSATPLNHLSPESHTRPKFEQAGCLHANMDLYKWSYLLFPWCGSDLLADAFLLAAQGRELDMRASPYDLSDLGFTPIPIETPEGRKVYEEAQAAYTAQAAPIRQSLIELAEQLLEHSPSPIS